jgi:hypothetical protein
VLGKETLPPRDGIAQYNQVHGSLLPDAVRTDELSYISEAAHRLCVCPDYSGARREPLAPRYPRIVVAGQPSA